MTVFLTMCDYFLWFAAYSIAGWAWEAILFRFTEGKWINRGFLYGPFCPIYGAGADLFWGTLRWIVPAIRVLGWPFGWSLLLECTILFLVGGLMACTIEYGTSAFLEHVFHTRWWDYFRNRFNIKGRVCLLGFTAFGAFAVLLVEFLQPCVVWLTDAIPDFIIIPLAIAVGAWMLADFLLTLRKLYREKKVRKANNDTEVRNSANTPEPPVHR